MSSAGRIQIATAEVHDVRTQRMLGSIRVEAPADHPAMLVDSLTLALLREELLPVRLGPDTVDLAGVMTSSVPALKAYIDGERNYRRGRWLEAAQHYQRAIDNDSMFAHAYDRIARAYGWSGRDPAPYADMAIRLAERLPRRDRALLRASAAWIPDAIDSLEAFTTRYPDDAEGWAVFGDKQFHFGGVTLRPTSGFRSALERAIELSPYFVESYKHLIEHSFQHMDSARSWEVATRLGEIVTESCDARFVHVLVWGEPPERAAAMDRLDTIPVRPAMYGCVQSALAAPPDVLDRVAGMYETFLDSAAAGANPPEFGGIVPTVLLLRYLQVRIPRGQVAAAREVLIREAARQPELERLAARWELMIHLSIRPDTGAARAALSILERDPDSTDNFWIGALAVAEGRWPEVERVRAALEDQARIALAGATEEDPIAGTREAGYAAAYAAVLEAWSAFERGAADRLPDFEAALRRTVPVSYDREQPQQFLRFRIGSLLLDRGDIDNAERYFRSFQPYDYFHTSQAEYQLARIHEARGETQQAAEHYARFIEWWQYADPDLSEMLDGAKAALDRLMEASS